MNSESRVMRGDPGEGRGRPAAELRGRAGAGGVERPVRAWARWPTWCASGTTATSAYYNVNTHINPTNVCVYTCDFCAFRADLGEDRAYVMDRDQIVERARQASSRGATELHIVGGLHHKLPFDYYVDVVRWIKETAPEIHIKAYTAVEIEFFCKIARKSIEERAAGAGRRGTRAACPAAAPRSSTPRSASRSAAPRPRPRPGWTSTGRRTGSGLHSNATMLYGHIDGPSTGSTTWSGSASSRTRPAGSRRSSRWRSTPTTRGWTHIPKPSGVMDLKIDGDQPADARQLPAHQGVLGHARASRRPRSPCRSAPTTSTARSSTRRSTTRPAPRRRRKRRSPRSAA